ncbi:transketolase, partial [Patescibacteria group bacterium]|nr:transketolase [Patescibacteria group bacterium]
MKKIKSIDKLSQIARNIRIDIIRSLLEAASGHSAGPLGMADVFTALYFNVLNHNPKDPWWKERDRLILSNGHICPVLYATLAQAGYFPRKKLLTLRKLGSDLQGHPHRAGLPGIENTSGPLGQGLSQACGLALAAKLDNNKHHIYCLTSDGELNEGQTWEAVMFAAKYNLNNVTQIMDRNNIQIDGFTEDIMPLEPLKQKYESFNWHVIDVDGHNIEDIIDACNQAKAVYEKPTLILAHTIPGKGVDFMENKPIWHGIPPDKEQAKEAIK